MFSLNATVPVFFVIFLGYFLKKIHVIKDGFVDQVNDLVFKVLFPVVLFRDVASTELAQVFSLSFFYFVSYPLA